MYIDNKKHVQYPSPFDNLTNSDSFSPIPQLDGPISCDSFLSDSSDIPFQVQTSQTAHFSMERNQYVPPKSSVASTSRNTVHQEVYTLNGPKQINKLGKDSQLQDFTIDISPSQQNVNIQCNAGFYSILKDLASKFSILVLRYIKLTLILYFSVEIQARKLTRPEM